MTWDAFALEALARAVAGGFVILAAAAVAVRLCRQPADRVRITGLALAGAVLIPGVAAVPGLPGWSVAVLPPAPAPAVVPTTDPVIAVPAYRPDPELFAARAERKADGEPAAPPAPAATASPPTPAAVIPALPATTVATPPASWWSPGRALLVGYAVATVGFVLWMLLGLWRLSLLRHAARSAPPEVVALLREIAGTAAGRVRLLVSDRIDAPVAFAGRWPVILLPESACDPTNREALRYGLAHEWSHVERGDVWRWWFVTLSQVVLFYQPLFWWLRRRLRLAQDYLADARAAGQTDTIDYAEYLVTLARRRQGVPGLALGMTDRRSNLTRRVHMLLLNTTPPSPRCRAAWTCGAVLVAAALVAGSSAVRLAAAPAAADDKQADPKKPADPPAGETLNYTGKVTDKDTGKPIAGATVVVRRSLLGDPELKDRNPVVEESKHTTDADGKYSFTIPPEQSSKRYLYIELDVEHPDYAPKKGFGYALGMIRKNEKLGGRPFFEGVELRPGKPVTGVVKTPDGKPLSGVKVMAYSVTSKRAEGAFEFGSFADTRTAADGTFRLTMATPGWAVLWVLPENYVPTTHVIKDKRGDLGPFTLQSGPRLKGTLLDARGKPLAGVIVNAESQERNEEITEPVADQINRSAVTNEKGEFAMNPLPPGNYLVKPGDYEQDASLDRKDRKRTEVPAVFIGTKVILKAGADPEPLEVRAVPHVTIEAQYLDSAGKPTRGHAPHVVGRIDGTFWFAEAKTDPTGKVTLHIPHGLTEVSLDLMTNEHGALRWRKTKDEPLNNTRTIRLGTVTDDVKGIEIIRYNAPILIVKVATKDGSKPVKPAVTAVYAAGKGRTEGMFILRDGRQSDVSFEEQEDGRFRSSQLFPDDEVTVTAHADGYASKSEKVKLAEGTTKEIELVLEKEEKKDGEKKD